jgi:hypothetical protein
MPALTADALVQHLEQLTQTGGADNRLVVASRDYYMIFHGKRGAPELVGEAVNNFYLPRAAELSPGRLGQLAARGYRERPNRNNLYRSLKVQDGAELRAFADEVLELFARAYGVEAGEAAEFELQLGEPEPLRNPELIRLMRLLSEKRDWDTRRALYTALLSATMLVPVDPEADGADEALEVDRLGKFPVIAAFTDITSLRLWQPRGASYRNLAVSDLVPRAVARRVGSLLINPKGMVGGELYLNELESLDGALKRRASPV